jgi:mono/diheme cytochrome c family protein
MPMNMNQALKAKTLCPAALLTCVIAAAVMGWNGSAESASASVSAAQLARGKYLVEFGGCNDCHTPGSLVGKPDAARYLGGSDVGFEIPNLGVFVGPNLTPDKETGLGNWTKEQIIAAFQTGTRPDGRQLATIMPWQAFSKLTKQDAEAIADYLMSLKPVSHKVPGPFGLDEKPSVSVMSLRPPAAQ